MHFLRSICNFKIFFGCIIPLPRLPPKKSNVSEQILESFIGLFHLNYLAVPNDLKTAISPGKWDVGTSKTVRTVNAVSFPVPNRLLAWPSGHVGDTAKQTGGHLASFHDYLDNFLLLPARDSCFSSAPVVFSAELFCGPQPPSLQESASAVTQSHVHSFTKY